MTTNDPSVLVKHVRKISRYEGITQGQAQVLLAAADALEAATARAEKAEAELARYKQVVADAHDQGYRQGVRDASGEEYTGPIVSQYRTAEEAREHWAALDTPTAPTEGEDQ